jgi:predicted MFS family arabinose efflux permease
VATSSFRSQESTKPSKGLPKVSPDGMCARVLVSFLASAGLFYVGIMPALVDGLKQGLGFNNRQAGLVGSLNVYGAACGAFLIAFLIRRLRWRSAAHWLLLGLISMDLLSMPLSGPFALMGARFVQGFIGGMLVGLGFSIIARTPAPDRTFGMLLVVQVFAGGLGVMSLPLLVLRFGTKVLFIWLMVLSVTTLVMLQFVPDYPARAPGTQAQGAASGTSKLKPLLLALSSVFLFQAGNMGLFAFLIGLGKRNGLELTFVSRSLGLASWIAILGAILVIVVSTRFGIFKPILGGMLVALIGTFALNYSEVKWIWIASNIGTGIAWNFVISHLLGMCARFDETGQAAVWSGFVSKMGLASGPLLASFILGGGTYSALIATSLVLLTGAMLASAVPAWGLDHGVAQGSTEKKSTSAVHSAL